MKLNDADILTICRNEFERLRRSLLDGTPIVSSLIIIGSGDGKLVGGILPLSISGDCKIGNDTVRALGIAFHRDTKVIPLVVIHIGDAWYVEAKDRLEDMPPSENPNRQEAVTFNAYTQDGRGLIGFIPYDRAEDGRVTIIADDVQMPNEFVPATYSAEGMTGGVKLYDRFSANFLEGARESASPASGWLR